MKNNESTIEKIKAYLGMYDLENLEISNKENNIELKFNTEETAISIFGYDNDPYYAILEIELEEEDRPIYRESICYFLEEKDINVGCYIEGIYSREVHSNSTATFEGTIIFSSNEDEWEDKRREIEQRYNRRSFKEHFHTVKMHLGQASLCLSDIEGSDKQEIINQYKDVISENLRKAIY